MLRNKDNASAKQNSFNSATTVRLKMLCVESLPFAGTGQRNIEKNLCCTQAVLKIKHMKTLRLLCTALLLSGAAGVYAQETTAPSNGTYPGFEIGARYMPTFSSFDVRGSNGVVYSQFTLSHGVGAFMAFNASEHVGFQVEGIYLSMSQKYRENDLDRTVYLNYMNFPLLLSLNTSKGGPVNLNIVGGPQFGLNVGSRVETAPGGQADTVNAVVAVKAGDVGIAYGAGLEFGLGADHNIALELGFRGVYGLIDISDKSKSTTTDQYYVLDRAHVQSYAGYVGLRFGF